ncbi:YheC/YheD family protein [Sporosarcina sp. HYO08]|uniref:YheC/YheD family protein n=1 Tax=Sporosarcina sp. HYO08 TaxID=1759557 RepID=UPI00155E41B2|nr:YheC/YheD family protein [Sporosarcina sp. HYO08]
MKTSRGRISLNKILSSDVKIANHLLETEQYTIEKLEEFLEKYHSIIIKPAFGPKQTVITLYNDQFEVQTNNQLKQIPSIEALHFYLANLLKQKYYIIQPKKKSSTLFNSYFHYYVTVHRKPTETSWMHVSNVEKCQSLLGEQYFQSFCSKTTSLATRVAEKLGEYFPACNTIVIDLIYDLTGKMWICDTILHFSISKWDQYQILKRWGPLSSYAPSTDLLTIVSLHEYLIKYKEIIIKPCVGQHGNGIVHIQKRGEQTYLLHAGIRKRKMTSFEEMYDYLYEVYLSKNDYIVQPKLVLASLGGSPFDVRVLLQKVDTEWKITGKLAKVAAKGFFITNAAQKVLLLETALANSNVSRYRSLIEEEMDQLCLSATLRLNDNYTDLSIIGFDVGVTDFGELWIIEANYVPDLKMFQLLEDSTTYNRIQEIKKRQ